MKTVLTNEIEKALVKRTKDQIGCYGALEVTVGYRGGSNGYQRCDYVEINTDSAVTCYEIKVTLSDLNSDNALTFVGNKNYLVVPNKLAFAILEWRKNKSLNKYVKHSIFSNAGLISYNEKTKELKIVVKCKSKKSLDFYRKIEILEGVAKASSRDFQKLFLDELT